MLLIGRVYKISIIDVEFAKQASEFFSNLCAIFSRVDSFRMSRLLDFSTVFVCSDAEYRITGARHYMESVVGIRQ